MNVTRDSLCLTSDYHNLILTSIQFNSQTPPFINPITITTQWLSNYCNCYLPIALIKSYITKAWHNQGVTQPMGDATNGWHIQWLTQPRGDIQWLTQPRGDTTNGWHNQWLKQPMDDTTYGWHNQWMTQPMDDTTNGWHSISKLEPQSCEWLLISRFVRSWPPNKLNQCDPGLLISRSVWSWPPMKSICVILAS